MGLEASGAESVRASESFSGSLVSEKVGTELRGQGGARCVAGRQSSAQMPLGADSYLPDIRNSAIPYPGPFSALLPAS